MARAATLDVLSLFRFHVDAVGTFGQRFLGGPQAGFASVTIPEQTVETMEYREGQHTFTKKLPGLPSVDTITLRRGVVQKDSAFWDWMRRVVEGTGSFRANVEIKHYSRTALTDDLDLGNSSLVNAVFAGRPNSDKLSPDATPARIYRVLEAFPVRCKLSGDLDATDSNVAVAELELAYEYIEMEVIG